MNKSILKNQSIFIILLLSIFILSCGREGCTDCKAINYDSKAKKHDNSCHYEQFVGTYAMKDSIVGPFQDVHYRSYEIKVYKSCSANSYRIYNFAKNPKAAAIECEIIGNDIHIPTQYQTWEIEGFSTWKNRVDVCEGYLSNDSMYIEIHTVGNYGDPYYGNCWGKQK